MSICPVQKNKECMTWRWGVKTLVVLAAAITIVMHMNGFSDWNAFSQFVILLGTMVAVSWSIWVVRTFQAIISWWVDMKERVSTVTTLLEETKSDLKEIQSTIK